MEGRLPGYFTSDDRTAYVAAEIATLRQELMAAKARIQETGRHNATEARVDVPYLKARPACAAQ
jgi:hypothetical protein